MEASWIAFLIVVLLHFVEADLHSALKHYDTLHHLNFRHKIIRRSVDDDTIHERHLQFETLGRHFHLNLRLRQNILSPQFRLVLIGNDLKEESVEYKADTIYEGYIYDEPWTSEAKVFFDEDDTITATIVTPKEVYNIEPSWRHNISLSESEDAKMIAYRRSDIIMDEDLGEKYCGYVREELSPEEVERMKKQDTKDGDVKERSRREVVASAQTSQYSGTNQHDTCRLLLVADYRFFRSMGQESVSRTANYLIGLIDRVDGLYQRTNFSNGFSNMGFEIKEMRIHQHPTTVTSGSTHYNMERDSWDTRDLLETFSRDTHYKSFCLAHLFTHQAFEGGVLGLAYIGSPRTYSIGGICSPALRELSQPYYRGGFQLYLNTGWSSSLNRYDRRLLTSEADLVTTHEFGHNWGSEHDPDTDECSPSTKNGGKHIMYTYSVSGYEPNNRVFSPCSRRAIGAVLLSKSQSCFSEKSSGFCGNYELEEGEECDVGLGVQDDPCCTMNCQLRPGAVCSDLNQVCCVGCQVASSNYVCNEAKNGSCDDVGHCNGKDFTCPPPPHKANGTPCLERGECRDGQCISLCESHDMLSCICDDKNERPENASWCKWCCQKDAYSKCEPFYLDGSLLNLPDGTPCVQGFCAEGVCEKQVQDLIERFWDIIENISPSDVVQFMRANIVGTIIVLSLLIWIPACCVVSFVDRKKKRDEEYEQYWLSPTNKDLYEWERPVLNIRRLEAVKSRPSQMAQALPPPPPYSTYV